MSKFRSYIARCITGRQALVIAVRFSINPLSICGCVVLCCASERLRTRDHGKRSNAQTVKLREKTSVGRTPSGRGPIRWRMGWVLAADLVRHSIGTVLSEQPGPRLPTITTSVRARQLVFDAAPATTEGMLG
ncbi:hypothetical protein L798_13833 [Zootermopsis nevadensis]|uniref:Uncharacterized protein n=1 Tax=Zootermopsis nevadensis TaxID=136037 RepID=A0A067QTL6_ZOONE|nr:hypothetical protein L798_13833 [Zootermopsis nevadensis]